MHSNYFVSIFAKQSHCYPSHKEPGRMSRTSTLFELYLNSPTIKQRFANRPLVLSLEEGGGGGRDVDWCIIITFSLSRTAVCNNLYELYIHSQMVMHNVTSG